MSGYTISITGNSNDSNLVLESSGASIRESMNNQFLQDFLNPNYFRLVIPFNFETAEDFDKVVNIFENDSLYGLNATKTAKGCLHILGWKDKDTLMYQIIEVWDKQESWSNYINWRLTGDPTFIFQQLLNNPSFPDVSNAPGGIWQTGYYDPNLITNLAAAQAVNGINISLDRTNYTLNPLKNTLDFIARIFAGLVATTYMPLTKQFVISESVKNMFLQTGGNLLI